MCGDGANDCGALRAAHTGISLSEAESSVASPFTSRNPNISCVINVIREGRAALVTSIGIFKYMIAYSICQFISVLLLYSAGSNLTDLEFLYIDLAVVTVFAFFFSRTETYQGKLNKETPLSSLISLSPILSLFIQLAFVLGFQVSAFLYLKSEPWFIPFNATEADSVACDENYTVFTVSVIQYIILAIVFSKGYPYRKSIFTNFGFVISIIVVTGFSVYLTIDPIEEIANFFDLSLPEDFDFRLILLAFSAAYFIIGLLVEHIIVDELFFRRLRFKFHNVDKSKSKYLAIERDMNRETNWPTLNSETPDSKSVCPAQIVIERENGFNKNTGT